MSELLLWVNEDDQVIGYGEKIETHVKKQLHRAFSVFIIDSKHQNILIQKRSKEKYHSGGLWSNACCSHWRKGELISESITRCVKDELGIVLSEDLNIVEDFSEDSSGNTAIYAGKFTYFSEYETLAEYEIDYVFVIYISDKQINQIIPNPNEIEDIKWIDQKQLSLQLEKEPQIFTAWFGEAYRIGVIKKNVPM